MELVELGNTGMKVSRIALGLAEISRQQKLKQVEKPDEVLNTALDSGINVLDTAPCYGHTEELIGAAVSHRRDEFYLATKCGHDLDENSRPDEESPRSWTAEVVEESIDRSLRRLRTDHLDLVQLHSPDLDVLQRGEVIDALVRARDAGKTRFIGLSADNETARWGVESGVFATLQTSFNLVEQRARTTGLFELAKAKGVGVLIKRPFANGVWGKDESPYSYGDEYFGRARDMKKPGPVAGAPDDPVLLALGFTLSQPEIDTIIVGTHNPAHVRSNIAMLDELPIAQQAIEELRRRFDQVGRDWPQLT